MSDNINVTPFSIGGASGDALYVYIDGRKVLSRMEKIEIERRVNNHDRMADEIAELGAKIAKKDEMVSDLIEALGGSVDETSELRDKHSKMSNEIAELCEALGAVNEIALLIASDIYEDSLLHDNVKLLIDIHK